MSRLEYLSDYIFNFTTYDGEMAELFARRSLEVRAAISNSTTFDYIKDADQYRWYLVMCNMPFFADKLEWGTSIRGAWWGEPPHRKIEFSSCGLFLDGEQLHETMEFTRDQWRVRWSAQLGQVAEARQICGFTCAGHSSGCLTRSLSLGRAADGLRRWGGSWPPC